MKESKEDDIKDNSLEDVMSFPLGGLVKSDPKESSYDKDGADNNSIKTSNAALQARLFQGGTQDSAELEEEPKSTAKSGNKMKTKQTSWVHMAKAGATSAAVETKRGAVLAEGTQFNDKPSKPAKKKC
jgi:hypothetical protein